MNLLELKSIIYSIKNEFNLNGTRYYKIKKNKKLFLDTNKKYNNIFKSIAEIAYLIKNFDNLENLHIFCKCGNKSSFINYFSGYRLFCSNTCIYCREFKGRKISNTKQNFTQEQKDLAKKHYQDSMMKNHGVKHNWASKDPKLNGCATRKERYNVEYVWASKDPELNGQAERERKYGNKHIFCIKEFRDKIVEKRKNDVDKNGLNSYERAGLKGAQTSKNNIDENGLNGFQRGTLKTKQYFIHKEGVDNYSKTKEFKDLWKNNDFVKQVAQKIYETKKKNKSFNNRSKMEVRCFELLKTKFPDAEHSYRDSARYPFNCDMYIPSLDLFIECHFGFAHGGEPFNPNNLKHLKEVERCNIKKEELRFDGKKKKSYAEKIKVWTVDDPIKLETFKKNNLNYKIFYTEKEFNEWFKTI